MSRDEDVILVLNPEGDGWLNDGRPWAPDGPFYAVLGDPVSHSLSPVFQGAAMKAAGLPYVYHAARIPPADLSRVFRDRGRLALRGFNVTAPHKLAAARLCETLTDEARLTAAVNTVKLGRGGWVGHNTDIGGLGDVLGERLEGGTAGPGLVLGAGGAARAAIAALLTSGADPVTVMARPGPGLETLSGWLSTDAFPGSDVRLVDWGTVPDALTAAFGAACVSCVPGGVDLSFLACAFDVRQPRLWLDMNYGARACAPPGVDGRRVCDGLPVLLAQGARAFTWWFDLDAPRSVMAASLA